MARIFVIRDQLAVSAPIERCFLLSTSLAIVEQELRMRPVRGRTTGLVVAGDTVQWKGWQLGLPQSHESLIDRFEPPFFFRDSMIAGRFRTFEHAHRFTPQSDGTVFLSDEVRFSMRWGWFGGLAGALLLAPHIRRLVRRRFQRLKHIAESEEWRAYLPDGDAK